MKRVIAQCWRGCFWLPHAGNHPGTAVCIGLITITGIAGAQRGGAIGFAVAALFATMIYGPMYFYGAYERARISMALEGADK